MTENDGIRIPLPPRDHRIQDVPPVIEPALRELPEYDGPLAGVETQGVQSAPFDGQSDLDQRAQDAGRTALNDERVRQRLGERHEVIGVSMVENKRSRTFSPVVVAYNYDDNTTVEVSMAGGDTAEVVDVLTTDNQPAPTEQEVGTAIRLARDDRRLGADLADDFEAVAILASAVDVGERYHGHRCLAVGFGPADERRPRVRAIVDLTAERVLAFSTDGAES